MASTRPAAAAITGRRLALVLLCLLGGAQGCHVATFTPLRPSELDPGLSSLDRDDPLLRRRAGDACGASLYGLEPYDSWLFEAAKLKCISLLADAAAQELVEELRLVAQAHGVPVPDFGPWYQSYDGWCAAKDRVSSLRERLTPTEIRLLRERVLPLRALLPVLADLPRRSDALVASSSAVAAQARQETRFPVLSPELRQNVPAFIRAEAAFLASMRRTASYEGYRSIADWPGFLESPSGETAP